MKAEPNFSIGMWTFNNETIMLGIWNIKWLWRWTLPRERRLQNARFVGHAAKIPGSQTDCCLDQLSSAIFRSSLWSRYVRGKEEDSIRCRCTDQWWEDFGSFRATLVPFHASCLKLSTGWPLLRVVCQTPWQWGPKIGPGVPDFKFWHKDF